MPDPPDVGNMLLTFVAPTRQEGQNKRTHFYLRVKRRSFGSGIAGFMLSGNQLRKLKTRNVQPETFGRDMPHEERAVAPNRPFYPLVSD
jgi:hypothetical protein